MAVTGASGQLGRELVRSFREHGHEVLALVRPGFDICRSADLEGLTDWRPSVVINSAAWTDVDGCAADPERANRVNGIAAGAVAAAAAAADALIVQVSTNEVFDGVLARPYVEDDDPNPLNAYGASKLAGERRVAAENARHLIVRTAWIYSARHGFPSKIRVAADRARRAGTPLKVVDDEFGNPTPAVWLAEAIRRLVGASDAPGRPAMWHLAGVPPTSRFDWARHVLGREAPLERISSDEFSRPSRVPRRAVLDCSRAAAHGIVPVEWRRVAL